MEQVDFSVVGEEILLRVIRRQENIHDISQWKTAMTCAELLAAHEAERKKWLQEIMDKAHGTSWLK